ncbi:MAG: dihydroorotate dehydrogenase, partial [Clostridiales bacterium]|nr:dihydroorotate dehydrogenase [Clostridiales bacterium]
MGLSKIHMGVNIAGIELRNPVATASGTFSFRDSGRFYDVSLLGAVTTKGVSAEPWEGNETPRIAESYGGMINSVGLENPGACWYIEEELPVLKAFGVPVIANAVGKSVTEYCRVVEMLGDSDVSMIEVNISCPNVKQGGIGFGADARTAAELTREVRKIARKPLILKLTPNVTDICEIAKAVECEGADCISLINTLLAMRIDAAARKPVLANVFGGLSGPAVKPVALRMVYQVRRAVSLPIIGMGGIMSGEDAAEFLMAGADAV